jgi:DNA repair photolyase
LTLNPYSGCDHNCVYCYASSYVPRFQECRPKKGLLKKLRREAAKLRGETVSISNSSDPYPRMEATTGLTRSCLAILVESNCRIQIITKSNLVTRDDDLLSKALSTVALTITTLNVEVARFLEPNAPPPAERLRAAEDLISKGVPISVRIDPVIPLVNDKAEKLVAALASIGVKHVTSSTYKAKPDNWSRFAVAMPDVAKKLEHLYFRAGEKLGGNTLLPRDLRLKFMKNIRNLATANGMKFGVCREDLAQLNTAACDGSWLLNAETR